MRCPATGIPSVITTSNGISASMASMIASLANFGGTKTTDTSAPVSFHRLGDGAEHRQVNVVVVLVLVRDGGAGLCARSHRRPTAFPPSASARCAECASAPVMPWTMTFEFLFRKIDIPVVLSRARPPRRRFRPSGPPSGFQHGDCDRRRVENLGRQEAPRREFFRVGAVIRAFSILRRRRDGYGSHRPLSRKHRPLRALSCLPLADGCGVVRSGLPVTERRCGGLSAMRGRM